MNPFRNLLWRLRIRNRFALAWWAFRNPDNLTMLRHDMESFTSERKYDKCGRTVGLTGRASTCAWWIERFLNLPVR